MKIFYTTILSIFSLALLYSVFSFSKDLQPENYQQIYKLRLSEFEKQYNELLTEVELNNIAEHRSILKTKIARVRQQLKGIDFWLRYLEANNYRLINGPLPVEWETEVFEKFEKPYKRQGGGLSLAEMHLESSNPSKDSLLKILRIGLPALELFANDSIRDVLQTDEHFLFCNRLFLLNLATIYTTGFECPEPARIIPELHLMMQQVRNIYISYNNTFQLKQLPPAYLQTFDGAIEFVNNQSEDCQKFDHYTFLKDWINPLFAINQRLIGKYNVRSGSYMDYSLNNSASSIFSKNLYRAQNTKGIFSRVTNGDVFEHVKKLGKLLFHDPILSGNNQRSCASCHRPTQFLTDTAVSASTHFGRTGRLVRNTPTLLNVDHYQLLMVDGAQHSLQNQALAVISNSTEMNCSTMDALKKIMSCRDYKKALHSLAKHTPAEPKPTMGHIISALTYYYGQFSQTYSDFDRTIHAGAEPSVNVKKGYNLFMGKAQCGTCHFPPQFNGTKPPYISSEFEVVGTPADTLYTSVSSDPGRNKVHEAPETKNAFRTPTIRNAARTKPYMHNGVFKNLAQLIDFYDAGGGAGHSLKLENQTLSSDSLHLSNEEKTNLIEFIQSLNEDYVADTPPSDLPLSKNKTLNARKPGGEY